MIIGYTLEGQDNDSYMLNNQGHPDVSTCPQCGFMKDFNTYHNPFYKIKIKTYDFSHPYDVGTIISLKFKEFCVREKYTGIIVKEFERQPNFYQLIVNNVVPLDFERSEPDLLDFCPMCKNYREAVGSMHTFLKDVKDELPDGFYRTDLLFGEGNNKNALIIVGPSTTHKLKREGMKGLDLEPIFS